MTAVLRDFTAEVKVEKLSEFPAGLDQPFRRAISAIAATETYHRWDVSSQREETIQKMGFVL